MFKKLLLSFTCVGVTLLSSCGRAPSLDESSSAPLSESWEDCINLNYMAVNVVNVGGSWKIVEGAHWAFDFGANRDEAYQTLRILKMYKVTRSCFVGRPGPSMLYQLSVGEAAFTGALIAGEDCIPFNNANVAVKWFPAPLSTWKIVDGNMWMLDFGLSQAEAYLAYRVIKKYNYNRQCFVGRPDPSFSYWKKL